MNDIVLGMGRTGVSGYVWAWEDNSRSLSEPSGQVVTVFFVGGPGEVPLARHRPEPSSGRHPIIT